MKIERAAPINELLAKLLFLILPTGIFAWFLLSGLNEYVTALQNSAFKWSLYFGAGMVGSAVFHSFRFRALIPFLALLFLLWSGYQGIDLLATGEFDQPVLEAGYYVFATLLITGWIVGWGFIRLRYWSIGMSAFLLICSTLLIAKQQTDTVGHLVSAFGPALLYCIYIIFTAEQIYSYDDKSQKFWWFLSRRLVGFSLLVCILMTGLYFYFRKDIAETVATYGGGGKAGENSMLKKNKDGNFDLKNYSQLRSQLGRSNELLFCARIDNFFEGSEFPNPLYLTAFYYTKFDTSTETFERDSVIPKNDLFEPDPSRISLFSTKYDSSVIRNSGTIKGGKTVEVQVYSRKLSPSTYLAPHTGYFVQPITVEKDFRDSFQFAFRAKSYVSQLNSAYFVYNADDPQIKAFQQERFKILREAPGYESEPAEFMKYYTYMPGDAKFTNISKLAHEVTAKATKPVDKVIAIRDWFLSKDAGGQALFKYTDNPGIPDIPNASKLQYFLFENRKGYCAYFAGATLFMLRSLGIPSRIAVGFLTVDRSGGKNKGWYWYYADQAHAWVQVYFPGYGWLDFDTTVGNDEAQQSPKPDGTPPMAPPQAYLAADGIVTRVDTSKKTITYKVHHFNLHDKEFRPGPTEAVLDVHIAAIRRDSVDIALSTVHAGDSVTAVSYADAFKNFAARESESAEAVLRRMPDPEPVDEVYLKRKATDQREQPPVKPKEPEPFSWKKALVTAGIVLAAVLLLILAFPGLLLMYYRIRSRKKADPKQQAYWIYRLSGFYLHQLGYFRGTMTPMQYAREAIDPEFKAGYSGFITAYLKAKYAGQELNERERELVNLYPGILFTAVAVKISGAKRFWRFLNPLRAVTFFVQPQDSGEAL
jgi:transglutaminase-like putative cysteine protease